MHAEVVNTLVLGEPLPAGEGDVYSPEMAKDSRFDGLDRRLGALEGKPTGRWIKRNAYWFFPVLSPILSVGTLFLAFLVGVFNLVFDSRINTKLEQPNGIIVQLGNLSTGLATANGELKAIHQLWAEQIKKTAQLEPRDFQKSLSQAADVLKAATVLHIPTSPEVKNSVRQKLLATDSGSPGYWPAAAAMVTYSAVLLVAASQERAATGFALQTSIRSVASNP